MQSNFLFQVTHYIFVDKTFVLIILHSEVKFAVLSFNLFALNLYYDWNQLYSVLI